MTAKGIIFASCLVFGSAVYALHVDKLRPTHVCRDSRLFMEGGYDAVIKSGGLDFHRKVDIYRTENMKDIFVATLDVKNEVSGNVPVETYSGAGLKLTIFKNETPTKYGFPANLVADLGKDKISVNMLCRRK